MKISHYILSLIVFAGVLAVNFSYAEQTLDERDCTMVDVSKPLGPVRDQGNIGWCYANVAADLLTFRYQKELGGQQASAGYVALIFNQYTMNAPNEDAGYVTPSILFSQYHGMCPQALQEKALKHSPFKTIRDQINALVALKITYDRRKQDPSNEDVLKIIKIYRRSKSYINLLSDEQLFRLLDTSSVRTFPRLLADKLCQKYKVKVKPDLNIRFQIGFLEGWRHILPTIFMRNPFEQVKKLGTTDLISEIHEELENRNIVAVGYNAHIFYKVGSKEYNNASLHSSSIVGRRWNSASRKCEFKLRNTWGKNCVAYTNPELKNKCDKKSGYLWLPETLLSQSIIDIVYYKK